MILPRLHVSFFFFNDTATTEIYTLSLHDALPIFVRSQLRSQLRRRLGHPAEQLVARPGRPARNRAARLADRQLQPQLVGRSEEHTSELQSLAYLVCRLLLEKKNTHTISPSNSPVT